MQLAIDKRFGEYFECGGLCQVSKMLDEVDYVSILKLNSSTTNEASPYSTLGKDASFRSIKRMILSCLLLCYNFSLA